MRFNPRNPHAGGGHVICSKRLGWVIFPFVEHFFLVDMPVHACYNAWSITDYCGSPYNFYTIATYCMLTYKVLTIAGHDMILIIALMPMGTDTPVMCPMRRHMAVYA